MPVPSGASVSSAHPLIRNGLMTGEPRTGDSTVRIAPDAAGSEVEVMRRIVPAA